MAELVLSGALPCGPENPQSSVGITGEEKKKGSGRNLFSPAPDSLSFCTRAASPSPSSSLPSWAGSITKMFKRFVSVFKACLEIQLDSQLNAANARSGGEKTMRGASCSLPLHPVIVFLTFTSTTHNFQPEVSLPLLKRALVRPPLLLRPLPAAPRQRGHLLPTAAGD